MRRIIVKGKEMRRIVKVMEMRRIKVKGMEILLDNGFKDVKV